MPLGDGGGLGDLDGGGLEDGGGFGDLGDGRGMEDGRGFGDLGGFEDHGNILGIRANLDVGGLRELTLIEASKSESCLPYCNGSVLTGNASMF